MRAQARAMCVRGLIRAHSIAVLGRYGRTCLRAWSIFATRAEESTGEELSPFCTVSGRGRTTMGVLPLRLGACGVEEMAHSCEKLRICSSRLAAQDAEPGMRCCARSARSRLRPLAIGEVLTCRSSSPSRISPCSTGEHMRGGGEVSLCRRSIPPHSTLKTC